MFRLLTSLILLALIGAAVLYYAYGAVEPCRVLAVERARRAVSHVALPVGDSVEHWSRVETDQLSTQQCASDLLDSWGERLSNLRT